MCHCPGSAEKHDKTAHKAAKTREKIKKERKNGFTKRL
jgi:hypothetical protein